MKTAKVKLKEVLIDEETYPRLKTDFVTVARYYNAYKSKAQFPPITVAFFNGTPHLVDGAHRLQAMIGLKIKEVEAEVVEAKTKQEIYQEAVKRNISHGRQFSTQEVSGIVIKLQRNGMNKIKISELVKIPLSHLDKFVAKRMVRTIGTKEKDNQPLKSSLRHLAGTEQPVDFVEAQKELTSVSRSQERLLDTLISMLEKNWIDLENPTINEKLQVINDLITKLIPKVKK